LSCCAKLMFAKKIKIKNCIKNLFLINIFLFYFISMIKKRP
jgi:hypothetical protein